MLYNTGTGLSALGIDGLDEVLSVDVSSLYLGVRQEVPTHELDVGGEVFAQTVTALTYSNLPPSAEGVWASNSAAWGCNAAVWGSNAAQWTCNAFMASAPEIAGPASIFASNGVAAARVAMSNQGISTSNVFLTERLRFPNDLRNNRVVLWEATSDNQNQFYGLGLNGAALRYQVHDQGASHRWFGGTGATTSAEIMRCSVNDGLVVNGALSSTTTSALATQAAYASNTSVFGSNAGRYASNLTPAVVFASNLSPAVTAVAAQATFGCNAAVFGSNAGWFGSNTATSAQQTASAAQATATSAQQTASAAQATAVFGSNAGAFGCNLAVWASNAVIAVDAEVTQLQASSLSFCNALQDLRTDVEAAFESIQSLPVEVEPGPESNTLFRVGACNRVAALSNTGDLVLYGGGLHASNIINLRVSSNMSAVDSSNVLTRTVASISYAGNMQLPFGNLTLSNGALLGPTVGGLRLGAGTSNNLVVVRSNGELVLNAGCNAIMGRDALRLGVLSNSLYAPDLLTLRSNGDVEVTGQVIGSNFLLFGTTSNGATSRSRMGLTPNGALLVPTSNGATHQLGHMLVTQPGFAGWPSGTVYTPGAMIAAQSSLSDLEALTETVLTGQVACARIYSMFKDGATWTKAHLIVDDADGLIPFASIKDVPEFAKSSQLVGSYLIGAGLGILGGVGAGVAAYFFAQKANAAGGAQPNIQVKNVIEVNGNQDGVRPARGMFEALRGAFSGGQQAGNNGGGGTIKYGNAAYQPLADAFS